MSLNPQRTLYECLLESDGDMPAALAAASYILSMDQGGREHKPEGEGGMQSPDGALALDDLPEAEGFEEYCGELEAALSLFEEEHDAALAFNEGERRDAGGKWTVGGGKSSPKVVPTDKISVLGRKLPPGLGTPSPYMPPAPPGWKPEHMSMSPAKAYKKTVDDLVARGTDPQKAAVAGRKVADYVNDYSTNPPQVYRRVLALVYDHTGDFEKAKELADRAGKRAELVHRKMFPSVAASLDVAFDHDIRNRNGQGILNRALKGVRGLTRAARRNLEDALDAGDSGKAILDFIDEYRVQLVQHLTHAQLAALLEGAREVAAKAPGVSVADAVPLDVDAEGNPHLATIEAAVKELRGRGVLTRDEYDRLDAAARAKAFTVAGVDAEATLANIRDALAGNVGDYSEFKRSVMEGAFLNDAHQEAVFRNNIQTALSDGQMSVLQHPEVKRGFPYATYDAIHDDRVREEHLALEKHGIDGTNVYRVDDPVFQMFRPPWDYSDRCGWGPLTVRQAAEAGVAEAQRWLDTGEEPSPPAFVRPPPFLPPEGFQRSLAGAPLSVRLSMQPLAAFGAAFAHDVDSQKRDAGGRWSKIVNSVSAFFGKRKKEVATDDGINDHSAQDTQKTQVDTKRHTVSETTAPTLVENSDKRYKETFGGPEGQYDVVASLVGDTWDLGFWLRPEDAETTQKLTGGTGAGAVRVMRSVGAVTDRFIREKKPDKFRFQAVSSEPSRVRLYESVAKMLASRHGYEQERVDKPSWVEFHFTKIGNTETETGFSLWDAQATIALAIMPDATFGMVGDEWHGPRPPGQGWAPIQPGPRGGKRWKRTGATSAVPQQPTVPQQPAIPQRSAVPQRPAKRVPKTPQQVQAMARSIKGVMDAGMLTAAHIPRIATALQELTVAQIQDVKKHLGIAATGTKAVLANSIAQKAVEVVTKANAAKAALTNAAVDAKAKADAKSATDKAVAVAPPAAPKSEEDAMKSERAASDASVKAERSGTSSDYNAAGRKCLEAAKAYAESGNMKHAQKMSDKAIKRAQKAHDAADSTDDTMEESQNIMDDADKLVESAKVAQSKAAITSSHATLDDIRGMVKKSKGASIEAISAWLKKTESDKPNVRVHGMTSVENMKSVKIHGIDVAYSETNRGAAAKSLMDMVRGGDIPTTVFTATKSIVFTSQKNAADAHWGKTYNIANFTSVATGGDGSVCVYSGRVMAKSTFCHESGHNVASKVWGSTHPKPSSEYGIAQTKEKPVTKYGSNSSAEDFAEAVKLYSDSDVSRKLMEKEFPLKYAAIKKLIGG